jgi:hypothetical protein
MGADRRGPALHDADGCRRSKVRLDDHARAELLVLDRVRVAPQLRPATTRSRGPRRRWCAEGRRRRVRGDVGGYTKFWHDFWGRSFVQYSNAGGDADYLETAYYLSTYMIAQGASAIYPFHFINGVARATQDKTKWSNAYWYWNQRDVYNSFLASNHADVMNVFNNMYSRNLAALKAFTMRSLPDRRRVGARDDGLERQRRRHDGQRLHEEHLVDGHRGGHEHVRRSTRTRATRPTSRTPCTRSCARPAKFYVKKFTKDAGTGKYVMELSNSHETYWNVRNAITDLAAVRQMFPVAIRTSSGAEPGRRPARAVAGPARQRGTRRTARSTCRTSRPSRRRATTRTSRRSSCGLTTSRESTRRITRSRSRPWKSRPFPYGNVWANDAIQAARLGLGDETNQGMKVMLQKYQNYPNGMTNNTNGVFEYLGVHLIAMNESLLQSYNDKIRVFPALPKDAGLVTRFTLAARGGFLVTSEREGGDIKYVGLKSQLGKMATVVNPWGTMAVQVRKLGGGEP